MFNYNWKGKETQTKSEDSEGSVDSEQGGVERARTNLEEHSSTILPNLSNQSSDRTPDEGLSMISEMVKTLNKEMNRENSGTSETNSREIPNSRPTESSDSVPWKYGGKPIEVPKDWPEQAADNESITGINVKAQKSRTEKKSIPGIMPSGRVQSYSGIRHSAPTGRGVHISSNGSKPQCVKGSVIEHIEHTGMHLHGAIIRTGTTATNADIDPTVDLTGRVHGFLPNAIQTLRNLALASSTLSGDNCDEEGRPYQFAIINVLGREDHSRIMRTIAEASKSPGGDLQTIIGQSGAPTGTKISTLLYNDAGMPFALGVTFPDPSLKSRGKSPQHIIFIHSTRATGGGKSDEKLSDGTLSFECSALAVEFRWWTYALDLAGGKIGGVDTTLGGTARTARYALLSASISRQLFAKEAMESIGVDSGTWVRENLGSDDQIYRANFSTTLLRAAWGEAGKRFQGIDIELIDRQDIHSRTSREVRAATAILRNLFLGHNSMAGFRGDVSDEQWSKLREQGITDSEFLDIHDTTDDREWPIKRRTEVASAEEIPINSAKNMALGQGSEYAHDLAERMLEGMRGLATERPGTLLPGGFITLTAYVDLQSLEGISKSSLNKSCEVIASSLSSLGCPKVLIRILPGPIGFLRSRKSVLIHLSEDQPGTNLLIASSQDSRTHERRTIVQNPRLNEDQRRKTWSSSAFAYGKMLDGIIDAHASSGHKACVEDSKLILAYRRHLYGSKYGNKPSREIGGADRQRERYVFRGGTR